MAQKRILMVDDEANIVDMNQKILKREGHQVQVAYVAKQGFDIFSADPNGFDLITLDVRMPGIDGVTLFEMMREINPTIPALFISAHAGAYADRLQKILETEQGVDFLQKPYAIQELKKRVASLLGLTE